MFRLFAAVIISLFLLWAFLLRPEAISLKATSTSFEAVIGSARNDVDRGAITFAFDDWGALSTETLRTSAIPWKLANAALALQMAGGDVAAAGQADLAAIWREFGFLTPDSIGNWPQGLSLPSMPVPIGQTHGYASRALPPIGLTIGNLGCAACHASVMYDAQGNPDPGRVWLGMPNGSINLDHYTTQLFRAVQDHGHDPASLMAVVKALYPETGWRERLALRWIVLPEFQRVVAEREEMFGGPLPFRASLAGATNGMDALRFRLGLIPGGAVVPDSVFSSIPDLGGRLWRGALLSTSGYAIAGSTGPQVMTRNDVTAAHRADLAGIIAFFTVPSMGVDPEMARTRIPDALAVTDWMATYDAQPFPGPVRAEALPLGRDIYARACASCHGSYNDSLTDPALVSFPNWTGDVGTDLARALYATPELATAVNSGPFGAHIDARTPATYAAPPLEGLWASAPYLQNGSIPTLWHLMRSETRPPSFFVGGHRIDLQRIGIDLDPPEGYTPWSRPVLIDTSGFGLSNQGHEIGFAGLTDAEKDALLQYLKLL